MANGIERYWRKTRRALVFGRDGAGGAVEEVMRADRAVLSARRGMGGRRWGWSACCGFTFLQQWFNPADPAGWKMRLMESLARDAPYSLWASIWDRSRCPTRRRYASFVICLSRTRSRRRDAGNGEPAPGEQRHSRITTGTIVDATIMNNAPSSTKNESGERDPAMRQTKKGGQWYFGMKAHVGVDSKDQR